MTIRYGSFEYEREIEVTLPDGEIEYRNQKLSGEYELEVSTYGDGSEDIDFQITSLKDEAGKEIIYTQDLEDKIYSHLSSKGEL